MTAKVTRPPESNSTTVPLNKRLYRSRPEGGCAVRVYHRKGSARRGPRYILKCGCCDQKLEIYYGDGTLEINGVMGSVENWREILLPLLYPDRPSAASNPSRAE